MAGFGLGELEDSDFGRVGSGFVEFWVYFLHYRHINISLDKIFNRSPQMCTPLLQLHRNILIPQLHIKHRLTLILHPILQIPQQEILLQLPYHRELPIVRQIIPCLLIRMPARTLNRRLPSEISPSWELSLPEKYVIHQIHLRV